MDLKRVFPKTWPAWGLGGESLSPKENLNGPKVYINSSPFWILMPFSTIQYRATPMDKHAWAPQNPRIKQQLSATGKLNNPQVIEHY